jgi:putative ABC transport system permease protein
MTFRDTFDLALRNLRQAKLRTSLTTLGVSIGIASLAGMVSLGVGLQDQFVGRFAKSGVFDSVTVLSAADLPGGLARVAGGGRRGFGAGASQGRGSAAPAQKDFNEDTIRELASMPHVSGVYPNVRLPLQMKFNGAQEPFVAAGIPMSAQGEGPFASISFGSFFPNDADMTCMLSLDLATRMVQGSPAVLVGRTVTLLYASPATVAAAIARGGFTAGDQSALAQAPCRIVGIVQRETGPGGLGVPVTPVMVPLGRAKTMQVRPNVYQSLTVKAAGPQFTEDVEDGLKKKGFTAFSANDALQGAKRTFIILDIVLSLIGSIALSVSALGIMNTMVMSILERTREIGIMKAIGGSNGDIRHIFLVEASAIGLLGGIAGVVLGWAVGRAINFGANIYIQRQGGPTGNLFSLPLWLIGGAIGFSIAVSLAAGLYPASRAARLDPIQALRHD